ncbi:linear amide C-N hydrolase [Vibrio navarrensis]|nr:linear amide C-N hydrolase [Vibrio navarrensis]
MTFCYIYCSAKRIQPYRLVLARQAGQLLQKQHKGHNNTMCTRILNNMDNKQVAVARNMDWEFHLDATLLLTPSGSNAVGMSKAERKKEGLMKKQVLQWQAKYASIATLLGDDEDGFGFCDGMNEKGFVANVLYDTNCSFYQGQLSDEQKGLSVLRWGQFMLDRFATVREAVSYFSFPEPGMEICFFGGSVPGDPNAPAQVHAAISDQHGDSAILEIHDGKLTIYHHRDFTVMTNEPDYQTQLNLDTYWRYQWNKTETKNPNPVFTAPGGHTSVQRFERASYYRLLQNQSLSHVDRVAQVAAMISPCKIPQGFEALHPNNLEEQIEKKIGVTFNSFTLWTNISDCRKKRYYLQSNDNIQTVWVEFPKSFEQAQSLCLDAAFRAAQVMGDVTKKMTPVENNPLHTA